MVFFYLLRSTAEKYSTIFFYQFIAMDEKKK